MKKILYISPFPTHPTTSGSRARALELCEAFKRAGAEVSFLGLNIEKGDEEKMQEYWREKLFLVRPSLRTIVTRGLRHLHSLLYSYFKIQLHADSIDSQCSKQYADVVAAICRERSFDMVIVQYVWFSKLLEYVPRPAVRVIDTNDLFAERSSRYSSAGLRPHWWSATQRTENEGFQRADYILGIQENESEAIRRRMPGKKVITLGHLMPALKKHVPSQEPIVGYLASDTPENISALQWFLKEVWPKLSAEHPRCKLHIAGSVSKKIPHSNKYKKTIWVENLENFFQPLQVAITPVLMGTGLKIKIVEALAHGVPVVTTPQGAEGIAECFSDGITVASDAESFQKAISQLLSEPIRREKVRNSIAPALEKYRQSNSQVLDLLLSTNPE